MPSLVVVGAGGLGREVVEAVRARNRVTPTWDLAGFLDDADDPPPSLDGVPVLGPTSAVADHPEADVVVCVGRPDRNWSRRDVVDRLGLAADRFATVVHPAAVLPPGVELGPGCVVLAGVIATTAIEVGAHVVLMPGTVLTHDDVLADHVTVASGVRLAGGVSVGEGAYVGAGALVREGVRIGPWSLVGMGAVVTEDVPPGEVWAGVPARRLRRVELPDHLRGRAS